MEKQRRANYYLKLKGHNLFAGNGGLFSSFQKAYFINRELTWHATIDDFFKEFHEMYPDEWWGNFTAKDFESYSTICK